MMITFDFLGASHSLFWGVQQIRLYFLQLASLIQLNFKFTLSGVILKNILS